MQRTPFQVCLLILLLLLAGCSGIGATSPPHAPGSSSSQIIAQPAAPLSVYIGGAAGTVFALNPDGGTVRWQSQVANASTTTVAALADGVVYVGANDPGNHPSRIASLSAFRASDGMLLWHKALAGASAIAAISKGVVYLTFGGDGSASSQPNEILALRAQDGSVLWDAHLDGMGPVRARLFNGTLYVTSFNTLVPSPGYYYDVTFVYALNASTGAVTWHKSVGRTNYVVAVADAQVYLLDTGTDYVCDPKALHVLRASDGVERWQTVGTFLNLLGVEQGMAYVVDVPEGCAAQDYTHGALYALHTADGSRAWQVAASPGLGALSKGVIYLPSAGGNANGSSAKGGSLDAYSARNGALLWHAQGESGQVSVFNGVLYTSMWGLALDALNPANGARQWRYQTGDTVFLSTTASGMLYGVIAHRLTDSSFGHDVVAFNANSGKLLWRFQIGTSEDSPIVG